MLLFDRDVNFIVTECLLYLLVFKLGSRKVTRAFCGYLRQKEQPVQRAWVEICLGTQGITCAMERVKENVEKVKE